MDEINIPIETAKAVFDIAINSMDFGSGFLDNAEVEQLRAFAVLIGVDPMIATPGEFKKQYSHPYKDAIRYEWPDKAWTRGYPEQERTIVHRCGNCELLEDAEVHK